MKRHALRGMTLIEAMLVIALIAMLAGGMFVGLGGLASARLRESSTAVVGAIRIAYNHANATSRPTRLVFDFEARTISIEESTGRMLIKQGDITGGAAAATDLEQAMAAEAEEVLEGPRAPRASFSPVGKILGFEFDEEAQRGAKRLAQNIYFRQIEVQHEDTPANEGRAYLYFWPGGQTELASIQIQQGNGEAEEDDVISITVAPLTGKAAIHGGAVEMPRPLRDEDMSERADTL